MIAIKSSREISHIRAAADIVRDTLEKLQQAIRPGVTTKKLDRIAEDIIRSRGAKPAFLNYHGFPATICSSINDEVVHGIPSSVKIVEGDIVSIDVGAKIDGYYADAARTFPVGDIATEALRLITVTKESFYCGMQAVRPGGHLGDIGHAIQSHVEKHGFSIVRDYVGHGIGAQLHEPPQIPNYGDANTGARLEAGMVFAIEPMVNAGSHEVKVLKNDWTAATRDGSLSSHYENTVLITEDGVDILTGAESDDF